MRQIKRPEKPIVNKCEHRIRHQDDRKIGKERLVKCKQSASRFSYFDGKDNIHLCAIHAEEYRSLNLTVVENGNTGRICQRLEIS